MAVVGEANNSGRAALADDSEASISMPVPRVKNTLNTNCYLLGTVAGAKNLLMSTWAHDDGVLVIENRGG